jgi:hypothetical protein
VAPRRRYERENITNQFDELTKTLARSGTRRAALREFGVGLASVALACFGLANKAAADQAATRASRTVRILPIPGNVKKGRCLNLRWSVHLCLQQATNLNSARARDKQNNEGKYEQ